MQQAASALKDESDIATEVERIEKKLEQIGVDPVSVVIQSQPVAKGKREGEGGKKGKRGGVKEKTLRPVEIAHT